MLIDEILNRVKQFLKTDVDAAVARALGVKSQSIVNWQKRGTIPWLELYDFSRQNDVSLDWLLTGHNRAAASSGDGIGLDATPAETIDMCLLLKDIMKSDNSLVRDAAIGTLRALHDALQKEEALRAARLRISELQKSLPGPAAHPPTPKKKKI